MSSEVSTNFRIPADLYKALKLKAVEENKSMKELIIEGISFLLGLRPQKNNKKKESTRDVLLKFAGRISTDAKDGSVNHDYYLYGKRKV